ncbi:hypothetical protein Rhow_005799 [Rhodococcus wratislaviensis]|uniref:Uncharacterized protein n=1 Tax=Rhodococcus wratislaviensis TaxID=44752 RepID=A0A402BZM7_RHOWR|nr:hypothetical protein Rhow_005799 [Rhodococcus wratislaviensis]
MTGYGSFTQNETYVRNLAHMAVGFRMEAAVTQHSSFIFGHSI